MLDPEEVWMAHGACRHRPELGWIRDAGEVGASETAAMRVTCAGCVVYAECAAFVLRKPITSGFWAGKHRDVDTAENYGGAA